MNCYAVKTKAPCKICGKYHGYLTFKHLVILAGEKSKGLLQILLRKYPECKIEQVDLGFMGKKGIGTIDIITMLSRGTKPNSHDG